MKNIPEPNSTISEGKKIWTTPDINSIYILDKNRIIEVDKDGKFLRQYGFPPEFENIVDFYIDINAKKIWVINDNKIYLAEY